MKVSQVMVISKVFSPPLSPPATINKDPQIKVFVAVTNNNLILKQGGNADCEGIHPWRASIQK